MCRTSAIALTSFLITAILVACKGGLSHFGAEDEEPQPKYVVDDSLVARELHNCCEAWPANMYADNYTRDYYQQADAPLLWVSPMGICNCADTLITFLSKASDLGLTPEALHADTLQSALHWIQQYDYSEQDCSPQLARIDFLLTRALLRYACGQRYGFVQPERTFNHLLTEQTPSGGIAYRRIYDMGAEEATDSFVHVALEKVRNHKVAEFLRSVEPTDTLYRTMRRELSRAKNEGDTTRYRLARINMERARWRYPHPTGDRYIMVNLAPQQLTAVEGDSVITMRVCCGNASHKTPLLHSQISYVELNPYWVIPQSIVRKEIMPSHVGDSAYYARNRYHAVDKETKEEVDAAGLTAADMRSGRYMLRQERGAGNSLGRIIFRFPNNFSVYLHDTNNHGAFQYGNRAISHGCVRVEKPLDLALFFLDDPKPFFIDRIRMAIDLAPLSAQGRRYQEANPEAKPLPSFSYDRPIPVWLDYWTLYPDAEGRLQAHPDNYGYDRAIEKILDSL